MGLMTTGAGNCGVEGPTDDVTVQALRLKQAKNMFVLWAMSQGTPMLLMGDEVLRSQTWQQQCLLPKQCNKLVRLG